MGVRYPQDNPPNVRPQTQAVPAAPIKLPQDTVQVDYTSTFNLDSIVPFIPSATSGDYSASFVFPTTRLVNFFTATYSRFVRLVTATGTPGYLVPDLVQWTMFQNTADSIQLNHHIQHTAANLTSTTLNSTATAFVIDSTDLPQFPIRCEYYGDTVTSIAVKAFHRWTPTYSPFNFNPAAGQSMLLPVLSVVYGFKNGLSGTNFKTA